MLLELLRLYSTNKWTGGVLFRTDLPERQFLATTMEDEKRTKKISGKARIPAGQYFLELCKIGQLHDKYKARYSEFHRGMIWLLAVPDFQWVCLRPDDHNDDDTEACITIGRSLDFDRGHISRSTLAYVHLYPMIAKAIENDFVALTIKDFGVGNGRNNQKEKR